MSGIRSAFYVTTSCYNIRMRLCLILHNIRSTYNVGAILRTAEGLGVDEVVYSGYTPRYNDAKLLPHLREKLNRQITKSALGAERMVYQETADNLAIWLAKNKTARNVVVGLENNLDDDEVGRKLLLDERSDLAKLRKAKSIILILGEEVEGIPEPIRSQCDYFLEIPMHGRKESFNVSIATAIALWELMKA